MVRPPFIKCELPLNGCLLNAYGQAGRISSYLTFYGVVEMGDTASTFNIHGDEVWYDRQRDERSRDALAVILLETVVHSHLTTAFCRPTQREIQV